MDFNELKNKILDDLKKAKDIAELEAARIAHLGRNAHINQFLRTLKDMAEDQRKKIGSKANELRKELEAEYEKRKIEFNIIKDQSREAFDVTKPAPKLPRGHIHPLTKIQEDITDIFSSMGFKILEGPEVESEYNNFDALNIPADHPARDMQDTFWLKQKNDSKKTIAEDSKKRWLLRTHTSPMQVRYMEKHEPPFRIIVPGRVYRCEATDMTHEFQFHQAEGLMIDRKGSPNAISMANLKGVMEHFFRQLFKDNVQVEFRASYFPFTEPSVEVYIKGTKGKLKGRWIEVAGAGMVNQNVFKAAGYVPGEFQGFAFGVALERLAMLKYKIDDIRLFQGSDLRFLKQF